MKPLQEYTREALTHLEPEALHHMACRASLGLVIHRILLGRCLLALQSTGRYQDFGCSGPIHYAIRLLGVTKKEANACRRVARQLEELPQLTAAAEAGKIGWAKLREIASKATPETEKLWLELASQYSTSVIRRLVAATLKGGLPGELPPTKVESEEITLHLDPETTELLKLVLHSLSLGRGRKVELKEALAILLAQHLQTSPVTEKDIEAIRARAAAVAASQQRKLAGPIQRAHELAQELGLRSPGDECFMATTAVDGDECPGNPEVELARRAKPHWRLSFNPNARGLTPAQTEVLKVRDCYCCQTPDCPNHIWLQSHHIRFFALGGLTVPANLIFLCTACHRNVHDGFLFIEGTAPDGLTFRDREGRQFER
ncbi:MAG: HNH endonuclease [Vulcanimicrobiota bacterium]